jgi:transposase
MHMKYIIDLTDAERNTLLEMTRGGITRARRIKRAQILLMAEQGCSDEEIADALATGTATVFRTRRRFVEEGIEAALDERDRPGAERKLNAKAEATLVAIACSDPPVGRSRWTLHLLADELVACTGLERVSYETIRRRLNEKNVKPWQKKMWCIRKLDAEFVAGMEDVIDLYSEAADSKHPVVCFDEKMVQQVAETREPLPAEPGKPRRHDYEYKRNGTSNIFLFFDPHRRWRHPKVTAQRTAADFSACMKDLVDQHYPDAETIRVVMDNLNTHRAASLYESMPAEEARRIMRRLEFHYTPKHASWLNMVEIEIGVMQQQCLDRRIADRYTLMRETAEWSRKRNDEGASVKWLFSLAKAREKLAKAYPSSSL